MQFALSNKYLKVII